MLRHDFGLANQPSVVFDLEQVLTPEGCDRERVGETLDPAAPPMKHLGGFFEATGRFEDVGEGQEDFGVVLREATVDRLESRHRLSSPAFGFVELPQRQVAPRRETGGRDRELNELVLVGGLGYAFGLDDHEPKRLVLEGCPSRARHLGADPWARRDPVVREEACRAVFLEPLELQPHPIQVDTQPKAPVVVGLGMATSFRQGDRRFAKATLPLERHAEIGPSVALDGPVPHGSGLGERLPQVLFRRHVSPEPDVDLGKIRGGARGAPDIARLGVQAGSFRERIVNDLEVTHQVSQLTPPAGR